MVSFAMGQNSFVENESPVEFLYLDKNRIVSLIGQMSDKGMLTSLKSTFSRTANNEGGGSAGLPGVGQVTGKHTKTSLESEERTHDPFWPHAYSFLQELEANFAVALPKGRLGSLVKFDSSIQFVDVSVMRALWDTIAASAFGGSTEFTPEMKLGLEMMKQLPHMLHMIFWAKPEETVFKLWAALRPEYMTINSEDLIMKFGAKMDGSWTVVAIVDGGIGPNPSPPFPINEFLDGIVQAVTNFRTLVGRPMDHWGITPIAIYTPIRGLAEIEAEEQAVALP